MLEPCAGESSGGKASNPQEDCPGVMERGSEAIMTATPLKETKTVGNLLLQ